MPNNRNITSLAKEVAKRTGLDPKVVYSVYMAYWLYIKEYIENIGVYKDITEEEFNKLKPNVNIPHLGKFYLTYKRLQNCNRRFEIRRKYRKNVENQEC